MRSTCANGWEALNNDPNTPPAGHGRDRRAEALALIVRFYQLRSVAEPGKSYDLHAKSWHDRLEALKAASAAEGAKAK